MQDVPCHTGMGKDGISMEGEAHNKKLYSVKDMSYFLDALTVSVAEWGNRHETDELGKPISN